MRGFWSQVALIAGTSMGAGMLAMPLSLGANGFIPSCLLMLYVWSIMFGSALFILELTVQLPIGTHLGAMAEHTLGSTGKKLLSLTYLGLLYSLSAAYLSGLSAWINAGLSPYIQEGIFKQSLSMMFLLGVMVLVCKSRRWGSRLNRYLVMGLMVSYVVLISGLISDIHPQWLMQIDTHQLGACLPILIVAFGFHIVIPSLRRFGTGNTQSLTQVLCLGSLLPLLCYVIWQMVILGVIPKSGAQGLQTLRDLNEPTVALVHALSVHSHSLRISLSAQCFSIFAMATSLIGVTIGLFDFISDHEVAQNASSFSIKVMGLTGIPSAIYAVMYPGAFMYALRYGGAFVAILLGIFPALMVYRLRQNKSIETWSAPGGRGLIVWVLLGSILILGFDLMGVSAIA